MESSRKGCIVEAFQKIHDPQESSKYGRMHEMHSRGNLPK